MVWVLRQRWSTALVVGAIGVVGLLARLAPVLRGGGLGGVLAYDDGVYFGASESFVFGRLPYRDFVLLHPPGILLALAPFSELARWTSDVHGLAAARLAFMCVGATSAVLVFFIARRISPVAGVIGGFFYALYGPAVYAERTTLLEPLVNLGLLVALLTLGDLRTATRRRALLGGAALGLAIAVKLWAVVPLLVLALWLVARGGWRRTTGLLGGSVLAATVVCLPFFLAAPHSMLKLVVLDQLGRTNNGVPMLQRLVSISDVHLTGGPDSGPAAFAAVLIVGLLAAAAAAVAIADREARVWASVLAAQLALLVVSPSYFSHYATYVAPAGALVLGASAHHLLLWVGRKAAPWRPVATIAMATMLVVVGLASQLHHEGRPGPTRTARLALQSARCVSGDTAASLIAADALARDLRHGCPLIIDVTGLTYTQDRDDLAPGNTARARRRDSEWQRHLAGYLQHSDAAIVQDGNPDPLDRSTLHRLRREGPVLRFRRYAIYQHPRAGAALFRPSRPGSPGRP